MIVAQRLEVRIKQLDVLRGLAILLVLGRHPVFEPPDSGFWGTFGQVWKHVGWTGVDLFFVLSGFLIGGLLFNEFTRTSSLDIRRFLIRRAFRIWPGYIALLLFMLLVVPFYHPGGALFTNSERFVALAPHFLHLQNYLGNVQLHTWSLAVEEHFYLFLPFLLFVLFRFSSSTTRLFTLVTVAAATLAITCLALRLITAPHTPLTDLAWRLNPSHLRMDSLFFGVFLSAFYHLRPNEFSALASRRTLLVCVSLILMSPMLLLPIETSTFVSTWGYTLLYLGYGCLVVVAVSSGESKSAGSRAIERVGISSYGIYLWHWHLSIAMGALLLPTVAALPLSHGLRWALAMGVYVFVAFLFGELMEKMVGHPALRLRDRLFPSVAGSAFIRVDPRLDLRVVPIPSARPFQDASAQTRN
jgi:peptidoglycan/LPS O-acetylase OafA/YrhL